jgi:hypothetical protein
MIEPTFFPMMAYRDWYAEFKDKLTTQDKEEILKQISDISLEAPLQLPNVKIAHDRVPKLRPYSHTGTYTGLQLLAVMEAIFKELHPEVKL